MEIRETRDAGLIAELNKPVQDHHYKLYPSFFKPYEKDAVTTFFNSIIKQERDHFIVCYEAGVPLGFIWFEEMIRPENPFTTNTGKLYIHMMSVNEEARGKGMGRALLAEVFAYAKERSIDRVELDYWHKNEGAKTFYNKLGFHVRKETAYIDL